MNKELEKKRNKEEVDLISEFEMEHGNEEKLVGRCTQRI